jgi:hypothetical protein
MTINQVSRAARVFGLALVVLLSACADEDRGDALSPTARAEASLALKVSDLNARVGDRIVVAIEATSSEGLAGIQGTLRFDPARLRFVGQIPQPGTIVIINESRLAQGDVRLVAMSPTVLGERAALFAFDVLAVSYTSGIGFNPEVIADVKTNELRSLAVRDVGLSGALPSGAEAVRWSYLDWAMFLDPNVGEEVAGIKANIGGLPTEGTLYGDATLAGGINVSDFADVGNTAVGNREVIIGTTTVDRVTAANVRPLAAGACQVGFSGPDCSSRVINVTDAIAIGQEAVGTNVPVVGDPIPLPKANYVSGDTVAFPAQTITGATRRFDRDSLYRLQGIVVVGQENVAAGACVSGELLIEPGTRIVGDSISMLVITRCGRIIADGTPTQPITFTCTGNSAGPAGIGPGCWGGLFVSGNAVTNEQDIVTLPQPLGPAPQLTPRNPVGGQFQRRGFGGTASHGGGNDADSSGVIRYVRFLYGGDNFGNLRFSNLTIASCGSGTVLSHIQVHSGEDDGIEFIGGRCNLKYLYATANHDDQFDYSFGYDGDVQFLVLQHARVGISDGDRQFEVDNTETATTYNNLPRTSPQIFNVTMVGGDGAFTGINPGTSHVNYRRGAGGTISNGLIVGGDVAFIVDNAQTCPANSGWNWNTTVVLGVDTLVKNNAACTPSPVQVGVNVDTAAYVAQLKAPFDALLPDFRPVGNGITSTLLTPATPPSGGFFDTSATYFGAVRPQGLNPAEVPWYAGWTVPWRSPTLR